jgi:two-component system, OmpR family, sensor kinase
VRGWTPQAARAALRGAGKMFSSVRTRLTVWYSAVLAVVLVVVCLTTYVIVRQTSMQRTDADLAALADSFLATFQAELAGEGTGPARTLVPPAHQAMIEHRSQNDAFVVLGPDGGRIAASSDAALSDEAVNPLLARAVDSEQFRHFESQAAEHDFETIRDGRARARLYTRLFEADGKTLTLIILHSLRAQHEVLETIQLTFVWMILLGLLLAASGGYFLARKSLQPVAAMGTQARRIGATNLHERLAVQNPHDELGQLAATFNDLLNRLDQSFERQRRFIADASHELRTPLAILRGEAEVAMSQKNRSAEEYLESLTILHQEARRLTKIVEDLFTLTRADSGQYRLAAQEVYLEEVVADCAHSVRTLAKGKNIELNVDAGSECPMQGDPELLRRMILNLLDNAIKYTGPGGRVEIACRAGDADCEVHVTDTGSGIPAELQGRVFERFFRADQARSRSEKDGGAGLGLSIAQWIAQAHHGRLELAHSDRGGSHFAVFLPLHKGVPVAAD